MKRMNSILRLFKFLLHIYPQNFKNEFGEEMLDVFEQNLMDSDNWFQRHIKKLREIQGWCATALPQNLLDIQGGWEDWRMNNRIKSQSGFVPRDNKPGTWRQAILWVPLIFLSSSRFSGFAGWYWMSRFGFLAITLFPAIGFCVAWIKRFPRWSSSCLGVLTAIFIFTIS
jgi:hypothetical protein